MQIAEVAERREQAVSAPYPRLALNHVQLKPKTKKVLDELLRNIREGRPVHSLWSSASSQAALQLACLLAHDTGSRVLRVRLQHSSYPDFRELEGQLDRLFQLTEDQGSILVLDRPDSLLCSRDKLCRRHFEDYLLRRLEQHRGTVIVIMPQHKRLNPRLTRRLHFALAV